MNDDALIKQLRQQISDTDRSIVDALKELFEEILDLTKREVRRGEET